MTFSEFMRVVEGMQKQYTIWCAGQTLFNTLLNHRPDLAEALRGSFDKDPFFADTKDDPRYVNAVAFIKENW